MALDLEAAAAKTPARGSFWLWAVSAVVLVVMLEYVPRLGGALLLVLALYWATQVERKAA